jgi:hypothetical protein
MRVVITTLILRTTGSDTGAGTPSALRCIRPDDPRPVSWAVRQRHLPFKIIFGPVGWLL